MSEPMFNARQVEWLAEQWRRGYTHEELADATFCHHKTICRALKKYGYHKVRPKLTAPEWVINNRNMEEQENV